MSAQTEINRIKNAATAIANAIKGKGVSVPTTAKVSDLATYVGKITTPNLQSKTVSPSTSSQTVKPDSSYNGLSQVTVNAISTEEKTVTSSTSAQTVTPSSGKFLSKVTVNAIPTETKTVTSSTSAQTVTPSSGKVLTKVTVNAIGTATQATPSISVSTAGLITASATQTAGYVSAGTKSATKQLTTQAAKYVTPSTSNQTAVASGVYTTGTITVHGDADLKAENIKKGVTIFNVTGSYEGSGDTPNPDAVAGTCTLVFYMDGYSPVGISCVQIEPLGVNAYYKQLQPYSTTTISNVVCGSTLLMEDTGGDGIYAYGAQSWTQTGIFSCSAGGSGLVYQVPKTSGTYYISFDRS